MQENGRRAPGPARPARASIAVALLVLAAGLALGEAARADTIFLKNGKSIIAESVTETGDKVYYEGAYGRVSIPKSLVDHVEKNGAAPARSTPLPPSSATPVPGKSPDSTGRAATEPERDEGGLPPAGIRLSLDPRQMDQVVRDGVVNDRLLAALAGKANESEADRHSAVNGMLLAAVYEARADQLSEASRWAEEALRIDGSDRNALLLAAQIDLARHQYREALRHMQAAQGVEPNSPEVLTLLGDAYYFSEGAEKAVRFWKLAQAIRPDPGLERRIARVEKEAEVERGLDQAESYHFTLNWQGSPLARNFGQEVLQSLEAAYEQLEVDLSFSPREPVTVILYGSQQFADITRAPQWAGALNDGKIRVPVQGLASLTPDLARVLKHELTHSFIFQMTEGRCPAWVQEGMAQLEAGEPLGDFGPLLAERAAAAKLLPMVELEGFFTRFDSARAFLAYGQSLAAIRMIREQYGAYELPELLKALRGGQNLAQALRGVLRISYADLDTELADYLVRRYGR